MRNALRSLARTKLLRPVAYLLMRLYWELQEKQWRALDRCGSLWFALLNRFARSTVGRQGPGPVVCMTTYGARAKSVYLAIESIAWGKMLPSRLILWIDEEDVLRNLPVPLQRLERRGLEIRRCADFGPHKKYYPYVDSLDSFVVPLVTADDDILYPSGWLRDLVRANAAFPDTINCFMARKVVVTETGLADYSRWTYCDTMRPSFLHIGIGVYGIIYPPRFLRFLKQAGSGFAGCAPCADDIWLHKEAIRNGFRVRQIRRRIKRFLAVPGMEGSALSLSNLKGGNDEQIRLTYSASDIATLFAEEAGG